jgi:hypothetical protein
MEWIDTCCTVHTLETGAVRNTVAVVTLAQVLLEIESTVISSTARDSPKSRTTNWRRSEPVTAAGVGRRREDGADRPGCHDPDMFYILLRRTACPATN